MNTKGHSPRSTYKRTQYGAIGTTLMVVIAPAAFLLVGVLAHDLPYLTAVKTQLQSATDAAALAGAQELTSNSANAAQAAILCANNNYANGKVVESNGTTGQTLTVDVVPPDQAGRGSVTVTASMPVQNLFGSIVGHNIDTITATSKAGSTSSLKHLNPNRGFPVAVNYNAVSQAQIGSSVTFWINSQQVKNAAFTGFNQNTNANVVKAEMDQALGLTSVTDGLIPGLTLGDNLAIDLSNGVLGQMQLSHEPYYSALLSKVYILPLVDTGSTQMNQNSTIVGFIAVRFTEVFTSSNSGNNASTGGNDNGNGNNNGNGGGGGNSETSGAVLGLQATIVNASFTGESGSLGQSTTGDDLNSTISTIVAGAIQLLN
jgi:Flp pilus assembly protein TadG